MTSVGPLHDDIDLQEHVKELNNQEKQTGQTDSEHFKKGERILFAAEKGRLFELLHLVQENPSLIHFTDADGYTPLHRASYAGQKDCVKYLLKHGANIEAKTNDGWTPLHCAVRWNNITVAEYLLSQGADVNAKSSGGNTPLHIVASNGRYSVTCDIIQLLLYHPNCDYSLKNNSGDTAFAIARRSGPFYKFWSGVMTMFEDEIEDNDIIKTV